MLAAPQGREGEVLLSITVDESGVVTEARSLSRSGFGFDEAAEAAARKFRFEPALRQGVPTAVRIPFRMVFDLHETVLEVSPLPEEGTPPLPPPEPTPSPPDNEAFEFGATAEVEALTTNSTRRTVPRAVMIKVPGTRGDALRAVEVLPGVSGSSNGNFVLRGAAHGAPTPVRAHPRIGPHPGSGRINPVLANLHQTGRDFRFAKKRDGGGHVCGFVAL
jgi:TonB family protein